MDASALVKLIVDETESDALERHLGGGRLISSALGRTETIRAVARQNPGLIVTSASLFDRIELVAITSAILDRATALQPAGVRSLDAIHVATALHLGSSVDELVTYDARMLDAASAHGIPVASPGA